MNQDQWWKHLPMIQDGPCVYLIGEADGVSRWHKIGWTLAVMTRLGELQVGNPRPLRVVRRVGCRDRRQANALEGRLHARFYDQRLPGREWFEFTAEDVVEFDRAIAEWRSRRRL